MKVIIRIFVVEIKHNNSKTDMKRILIGGQALKNLGSSRHTDDVDYLINDTTSAKAFIHDVENNVDYCNANGNRFFGDIYAKETGNETASVQSLFELKAFAFVQHCQNRNFAKVDACEFDIKFITRIALQSGVKLNANIIKKYVSASELQEIVKIVNSVRI